MKIFGTIFLILGLVAAVNALNSSPPRRGSEQYNKGYRLGQVAAPVMLIGLGLGLLLRRGAGSRSTSSRPVSTNRYSPPAAPPAAFPSTMPVKIECSCGQHYEFEVEPVAGRMPSHVGCPACGVDGTDAANTSIAQTLALRAATPVWSQPATPRRKFHPALIVGIVVSGLVILLVAVSFIRTLSRFNRARPTRPPAYPSEAGRLNFPPASPPNAASGKPRPPGKPGSARDATPVPPGATSVEVFWGSRWYEATVLRRDGPRAFIHYEGWSSNFDEWVTPDRLRPRR